MLGVFGQMEEKYFSNAFTTFLQKEGIRREFTCWYTPQQNEVAERKNQHILEVARAMMNEKNLSKLGPNMYNRILDEQMHNIQRTWHHPTREVLWKKVRLISPKDIRHYCIHAHSRWEKAKARSKIRKMHSCGVFTWAKGVQVLQLLYSEGSRELWRIWRIEIMVCTRLNSIRTNWGRSWHKLGGQYSTKPDTRGSLISTMLSGPQEPLRNQCTFRTSATTDRGKG